MKTFIDHGFVKLQRETSADGSRVYKTPSGIAYPSVTSVTSLYTKQQIIKWRKEVGEETANKISARASKRGTAVHSLCEDYLKHGKASPNMFDQELFSSIKPHLDCINNIHALESPLYSDHLQVAGTVDCIAEYNGKISVIDFKTSSKVKLRDNILHYFMQCSAYAVAFEERTKIPVSKLVIIMAVDDNPPQIFVEKRDDHIGSFLKLREDYRKWKKV